MALKVRLPGDLTLPADVLGNLAAFRAWTLSSDFPDTGRIDFLDGDVEVDMTAEEIQSHAVLKLKLGAFILSVVEAGDLGQVVTDSTRLVHAAGLSCEPDVMYVSWEALKTGRARYVPSTKDKLMELEGAATLVVEIVSDSSVEKDLERLPPLYARAGVEELWLVDARGADIRFDVLHLTPTGWPSARPDRSGFRASRVLGRSLRLRRDTGPIPRTWRYHVDDKAGRRPARR